MNPSKQELTSSYPKACKPPMVDRKLPRRRSKSKVNLANLHKNEGSARPKYIDKILDVEADGLCEIQVIVWALGRGQDSFMDVRKEIHNNLKGKSELYLNQEFLDEIARVSQRIHVEELGPCDIDHWMSKPRMGHLMAELYNRPVFYYVKSWSQTFFPSTTLPNNNTPIFMGLTESPNFVVFKMKNENIFPAAQMEKNWEQIATPEVIQLKNRYLRC
ncbi:hypothetical protein VP01_994g5 [Puccinia sorghi]|uniref:OTU domain-containing protein n=1 Tax=Puccinia sorghi TaxID=27349 RepID=A0A0L6U5B1_9BASI|nr:hypothetical protein VP01_994g5 [Puccinia sorghi]